MFTFTENNLWIGLLRCRKGYKRDTNNRTCIDIDECETGEADCDLDEQVCFNTDGSFKCIDVSEPSACPDGYRYNVKTETCQGMSKELMVCKFVTIRHKSHTRFLHLQIFG